MKLLQPLNQNWFQLVPDSKYGAILWTPALCILEFYILAFIIFRFFYLFSISLLHSRGFSFLALVTQPLSQFIKFPSTSNFKIFIFFWKLPIIFSFHPTLGLYFLSLSLCLRTFSTVFSKFSSLIHSFFFFFFF